MNGGSISDAIIKYIDNKELVNKVCDALSTIDNTDKEISLQKIEHILTK